MFKPIERLDKLRVTRDVYVDEKLIQAGTIVIAGSAECELGHFGRSLTFCLLVLNERIDDKTVDQNFYLPIDCLELWPY